MSDHWERQLASIGEVVRLPGAGARDGGERTLELALAADVGAALERVTGGRDTERLVVLAACLAAVLARVGDGDTVVIELARPGGAPADWLPVAVPADLDRTLPETVRELDAAFAAAQDGPPLGAAQRAAYGALIADLPVGAGVDQAPAGRFALHARLRGRDVPVLELTVDERRVDADAAAGIAGALSMALAALADGARPLRALELVGAADRERLGALGAGPAPAAGPPTFPERFAANVERRGGEPAVVCGGERLTYAQLDARAAGLAGRLRERGAGPETVVAIDMPKGLDAIVAIVATLKAGAAWLALDPDAPPERRRSIVAAARPVALLGADDGAGDGAGAGAAGGAPDAAQLAYVIATSGSTGAPKLVAVEHGSLANYLAWKLRYHGMGPATVCLGLAPLSFDSAVSDVLCTLACGGLLVLVPGEQRLDPAAIGELARAHGATTLAAVPSHYRTFADALPADGALELVTLAGERLTADVAAEHARLLPGVRLVNEYGPSECTIAATACDVETGAGVPGDPPIGRPLDGVRVALVDRAGRLLPPGLPGEIAVAGAGLARGYLGAAGAGGFGADPDDPARRVYRTGDRGRWRADGQLAYAGRLDEQVKIRGNRVELGEIETALRAQDGVAEAAVVVRSEGARPDLVAYVVPAGEAPNGAGDEALRAALEQRLPAYMLPARFVAVDSLPLSPNGKLDRRALASRELPATAPASGGAPADELEERLLALWRSLLESDDVGVDDGFFERGGHSLLAVQLVTEIAEELELEMPLGELFDNSSVRAAAGWLRLNAGVSA